MSSTETPTSGKMKVLKEYTISGVFTIVNLYDLSLA